MRITTRMMADNSLRGVQYNSEKIGNLQQQVSYARRLMKPSDDPTAMSLAMDVSGQLRGIDQYERNIERAKTWLGASDAALTGINDALTEARSLAVSLLTDTTDVRADGAVIQGARQKLESLIQRTLQAANTNVNGEYLFSGASTRTTPFVEGNAVDTSTTPPTTTKRIYYVADDRADPEQLGAAYKLRVSIAPGTRAPISLNGTLLAPKASGTPPSGDFSADTTFNVLTNMRTLLATSPLDKTALRAQLGALDKAMDGVLGGRSEIGSSLQTIEGVNQQLASVKLNLKETWSRTVDLDMAEAITQLNVQEKVYQASLQATGKTQLPSLMDFLQ